MELKGEKLIPASQAATWAALNDPDTLKACIAGCESLERTGQDSLTAVVAMKVGPVSARFKGNLAMTNVRAPESYTINFDGQGGVAGFGKGSADVVLTPEGEGTRLTYLARATVGGKMAQIGSRLIDATAGRLTEDFFRAFEDQLRARNPTTAETTLTAVDDKSRGAGAQSRSNADSRRTAWLVAGAIALAVVMYLILR